jgi:hypothetical protein
VGDVVGPAGVAAVDDDVARREQAGKLVDHGLGGATSGNHHPHHPRRLQCGHQLRQAADVGEVGVAVVADNGVARAADAFAHVAAHLAQADESEFHFRATSASRGR